MLESKLYSPQIKTKICLAVTGIQGNLNISCHGDCNFLTKFVGCHHHSKLNMISIRPNSKVLSGIERYRLPIVFTPLVEDRTFCTSVILLFVLFIVTVSEMCEYFVRV